jgi:outer membrane receptor protein involved in Fe transport
MSLLSNFTQPYAAVRFRGARALAALFFAFALSATAWGAEAKKDFIVPAGDAASALRQLARQAGQQVVFPAQDVRGVKTAAINGNFTLKEALDDMLRDTGLQAAFDEKSGTFAVSKVASPNAERAAPATRSYRPDRTPAGETIMLDPFEAQANADKGYAALNSNSITAFNTALEKLPITADILDRTFMDDTAMGDVESLITGYSAGAGTSSPDPASTASSNQPGDRVSGGFLQLRGLTADFPQRDSLLPIGNPTQPGSTGVGFTSNFDVDRVEIINGPQALLYGSAGAGGVVNIVSKQARIGAPTFGSLTYKIDQFGGKMALFDYGTGTHNVAVRIAAVDQSIAGRRMNIGGSLHGYYLQLAANVSKNTTLRIEGEKTTYDRIFPINLSLNAGSAAIDARHGDSLTYLLATHQVQQAASGPSGAGPIDNGYLNWSNVNSFEGWYAFERTVDTFSIVTANTRWNDWLSTKLMAGYSDWNDVGFGNTVHFYSPTATSNPLPNNWTFSQDTLEPDHYTKQTSRAKTIRYITLATNEFFGGRAHSQSILGFDMVHIDFSFINYSLVAADSSWNPIYDPSNTTLKAQGNAGLTPIPHLNWTVNQGPILYPFFQTNSNRVILNGANYVRTMSNPVQAQLISPANPQGVTLGGDTHQTSKMLDKGVFGTNYTDWMDGRLTTLVGFRLQNSSYNEITAAGTNVLVQGTRFNYNLGANYRLTHLLRPYFSVSSSFDKPTHLVNDPYGNPPALAHGIGEEIGVKIQNPEGTISGSLGYYHVSSRNEQFSLPSTLTTEINPTGLNGTFGKNSAGYVDVHRESEGVQLTLTAAPTSNWRMRLSTAWIKGTIGTSASIPQLYNDQFHENSQGQVTYADGAVVYVPATFNSKTPTTSAGTPGAIPLTVGLLSDPTSSYYANPKPVSAQITSTSNGGKVLLTSDAVHGSILTGAVGLPISALQINPTPSGVTVPGTIVASRANDATTGYPELSMSFTNIYTFSSGWAKGFEIGESVNLGWFYRDFYYFPENYTGSSSPRSIFQLPTQSTFNLIAGYTHRFKRITWHSQVNVANIFNHYSVVVLPGEITGWTQPTSIQATFSKQPRSYQWTNNFSF